MQVEQNKRGLWMVKYWARSSDEIESEFRDVGTVLQQARMISEEKCQRGLSGTWSTAHMEMG